MHPADLPEDKLLDDCTLTHTRGSGPGGQHRNKVQTKVVLTHTATGHTAQAGEKRSQAENRKTALRRLRLELALHVRTQRDAVSTLWQHRRAGRTLRVNPRHVDYPALLAEALDTIARFDADAPAAAQALGVSTSQLVKLLKDEPRALAQVNQQRQAHGQKPLR